MAVVTAALAVAAPEGLACLLEGWAAAGAVAEGCSIFAPAAAAGTTRCLPHIIQGASSCQASFKIKEAGVLRALVGGRGHMAVAAAVVVPHQQLIRYCTILCPLHFLVKDI
jgi:hypothetical protein